MTVIFVPVVVVRFCPPESRRHFQPVMYRAFVPGVLQETDGFLGKDDAIIHAGRVVQRLVDSQNRTTLYMLQNPMPTSDLNTWARSMGYTPANNAQELLPREHITVSLYRNQATM